MEAPQGRMNEIERFRTEVAANIERLGADADVQALARIWLREITPYKYAYNFSWMGRPIIQFPQDMIAMQEIIWRVRPELIIETGVAHGGSLIYYASLLELVGGPGRVLGIDIDIRAHNRAEIESHSMSKRIDLIEGSSTSEDVVRRVAATASQKRGVLVVLDSNHTHDHVLAELRAYGPLVTADSYLVVFDTLVDDMPESFFADRPWKPGNSPKSAVRQYLLETDRFEVDRSISNKLCITVAPDGYLRCVK